MSKKEKISFEKGISPTIPYKEIPCKDVDLQSYSCAYHIIKLLDDLYKQTHTKEFLVLCSSAKIKKELENLDTSYLYDIIIEPNIHSVNCGEAILPHNNENIYVIPKNQIDKPLGILIDSIPTAFLEKIPVEVNYI